MSNHVRLSIIAVVILFTAPMSALAQVPAGTGQQSLIEEYIVDYDQARRASWWNLLGRQLTNKIDKDYEQVSVSDLQNIIYFANHHKDKVNLNDAVPFLLDIVEHHEERGYRVMAVSALHIIEDRAGMQTLRALAPQETDERVKHVMTAALSDYYGL